MKTGAETTSLLLLQEFSDGKPESVHAPSQDTRLLCLSNKSEAAQNNKHSHVSAAQNFLFWGKLCWLCYQQTPLLAFFTLCIHLIYSFF